MVIQRKNVTTKAGNVVAIVEIGIIQKMIVAQKISSNATRRVHSLDLQMRWRYLKVSLELYNRGKKVEIKRALGAGSCLRILLSVFSFFVCSSLAL